MFRLYHHRISRSWAMGSHGVMPGPLVEDKDARQVLIEADQFADVVDEIYQDSREHYRRQVQPDGSVTYEQQHR